jgi:hypothetical protein
LSPLAAGRASTTQHHTLTPLEHLPALAAPRTRKIHFAGDVNPNIQGFMEGTVSGAERAAREGDPVSQADAIALATTGTAPDPGAVPAITVPAGQAAPDGSAGLLSEKSGR